MNIARSESLLLRDLTDYVHDVAAKLGVGHYRIEVVWLQTDDRATDATTSLQTQKRQVRIKVAREAIARLDADAFRVIVVHEVLHVALRDTWRLAQETLSGKLIEVFEDAHEAEVDGLAHALAPLMPYPPWCAPCCGASTAEAHALWCFEDLRRPRPERPRIIDGDLHMHPRAGVTHEHPNGGHRHGHDYTSVGAAAICPDDYGVPDLHDVAERLDT